MLYVQFSRGDHTRKFSCSHIFYDSIGPIIFHDYSTIAFTAT